MLKKQRAINNIFFFLLTFASIYLIFKNRNSTNLLLYIVLAASSIYLAWAAIFHKMDKSLTLAIFIEYLLTAVLVLILLMGILF